MATRCLIFGALCVVAGVVMTPSQSAAQPTEDLNSLGELELFRAHATPLAERAVVLEDKEHAGCGMAESSHQQLSSLNLVVILE